MVAIFCVGGVLWDGVHLEAGGGDRDRSGNRFLGKGEGEGLVDGFRGGDSGGRDEGDGDSGVDGVRHGG